MQKNNWKEGNSKLTQCDKGDIKCWVLGVDVNILDESSKMQSVTASGMD